MIKFSISANEQLRLAESICVAGQLIQLSLLVSTNSAKSAEKTEINDLFNQVETDLETLNVSFSSVKDKFIGFNDSLYYDGESISEVLDKALTISEDAINSFGENNSSRNDIFNLIDDASNEFVSTIQEFVDYVVSYVENDFAKCGPLKYTYDLVDNSLCYRIIQPFNGLWTGLGLYLILMFPILIMSCLLEPLFRRFNKPAYTKDRHVEMAGELIFYSIVIRNIEIPWIELFQLFNAVVLVLYKDSNLSNFIYFVKITCCIYKLISNKIPTKKIM